MKATTYTFKHDIKALASTIDLLLNNITSEHFMSNELLFEIKVVLNELIVNALFHGNNCDLDKVAIVTFKLINKDYLYISVKDEGYGCKQIDYVDFSDNYLQTKNDLLCEHGRGLVIVERLCDRVKFSRYGNKVSIIKNVM